MLGPALSFRSAEEDTETNRTSADDTSDGNQADAADEVASCDELAARWLAAEDRAGTEPSQVEFALEAARLGELYDNAVRAASQEDLRLAWEAARYRQRREEVGTPGWSDARRVSELLRVEYEAARPNPDGRV